MDPAPNTRLEAGFEIKRSHVEMVGGIPVTVIDEARLNEVSVVPDTPENRAAGAHPVLAAYSVDTQTEPGVTRVHIAQPGYAPVLMRITGQTTEFDTPDAEGTIMLRSTYYGRVEPYGAADTGAVGSGADGAVGGAAERPGGGGAPAGGGGPADRQTGGGDPGGRPSPTQPDAPGGAADPRRVPPSRQRPDALPD